MLEIRPCDFKTAVAFVEENHRHNKPPVGHKYSISVWEDGRLCGVCMVGRPIARLLDNGLTLEVYRCCTDGTRNACTMLYGAAVRAAKALGYKAIVTYTRVDEPGTSLKASGWAKNGEVRYHSWSRRTRKRTEQEAIDKIRWRKEL